MRHVVPEDKGKRVGRHRHGQGAFRSVAIYTAALLISYVCGYLITDLTFDERELKVQKKAETPPAEKHSEPPADPPVSGTVKRGDLLYFDRDDLSFTYTIRDPAGIHARPAAELAKLVKKCGCEVTVKAGEKTASADSLAELMDLGAVSGAALMVTVKGPDAAKGLPYIKAFFEENL